MGIWKNGAQACVMLTFDFDAELFWIARDPKSATRLGTLAHGMYGGKQGALNVLRMLKEVEAPATFFIPGVILETYPKTVEKIVECGHEIGAHSWEHKWVEGASFEAIEEEFLKTREVFESITGQTWKGWRSHAWDIGIDDNYIRLLQKYNLGYSSSLMLQEDPYLLELDGQKTDIVELPVHWILDDAAYWYCSRENLGGCIVSNGETLRTWQEDFDGLYKMGSLFNLTLHPQFVGRPGRVEMLRNLILWIRKYPNVWFATADEVANYYKDNKALFDEREANLYNF